MNSSNPSKPATLPTKPEAYANSTRDFFRVASFSTALGFGCAAGSLQALHWNKEGVSFNVSWWTALAFVAAAALTMLYWRAVSRSESAARKGTWLLVLAGIGLFLYPLRFVPAEKLPEVATGLVLAAIALSTIACMLWQLKRYFEQE